jgi:hypothetical protein
VEAEEESFSFRRLLGTEREDIADLGLTAGVTAPVLVELDKLWPDELTGVVARGGTEPARVGLRLFS